MNLLSSHKSFTLQNVVTWPSERAQISDSNITSRFCTEKSVYLPNCTIRTLFLFYLISPGTPGIETRMDIYKLTFFLLISKVFNH